MARLLPALVVATLVILAGISTVAGTTILHANHGDSIQTMNEGVNPFHDGNIMLSPLVSSDYPSGNDAPPSVAEVSSSSSKIAIYSDYMPISDTSSDADDDGVVAFYEYDNDVRGLNVAKWLAAAEENEIKFTGTAIEYFERIGACGWNVSVDELVSGPQPLTSQLEVITWWSAPPGPPWGYVDPDIEEGDEVEVYGAYREDGPFVLLEGSEEYYIKKTDECASLVKFKGVATTDESYGEVVCYGSYCCTVKVEEILQDPDNTLLSGNEYQVCYGATQKNIKTGDKLEVFGDYYHTRGPLQYVGNIVAFGDGYYVEILVEEAVNFVGVVENEPSEPCNIGVRIDEVLLDPEGTLSPGDLANIDIADDPSECDVVWPVHEGDRVEVFAKHYDYDCWLPSYDICVWIYSEDNPYDGYLKLVWAPDLNSDGILTPADATIALRLAATGGWDPAADMNRDSRITSIDALMILQAAAGAIAL